MTAPDSRYLDEAMARLTEAVAQPVGGSIVISTADACAIGNELRRLQALARGPQQAGGEDAEIREILFGALDRDRDNITTRGLVVVAVNALQRERERAEAAEAALREESARLDWLIENRHLFTSCNGQWFAVIGPAEIAQRDAARAAIDAARLVRDGDSGEGES